MLSLLDLLIGRVVSGGSSMLLCRTTRFKSREKRIFLLLTPPIKEVLKRFELIHDKKLDFNIYNMDTC